MALPPKDDPRRPLYLAIRSTRLLGILFLLLGSCVSVTLFMPRARVGSGAFGPILAILVYVIPGAADIVFAIYLKERKLWAVIAALIVSSIQLVFALFAFIGVGIAYFAMKVNGISTPLTIMAIIVGLVILALAQLIYHLALSFKAIQYVPLEEQRGFEPVMLPPVLPPVPPSDLPPV